MKNVRQDPLCAPIEALERRLLWTMVVQDSEFASISNNSSALAQGAILLAGNNPVRIEGVAESSGQDWYLLRAGSSGTLSIKPSSYPGYYPTGWQISNSAGSVLAWANAGSTQVVSTAAIVAGSTYFLRLDANASNVFYAVDLNYSAGTSGARFQDSEYAGISNNARTTAKGLVHLRSAVDGSFVLEGNAEASGVDWYAVRSDAGTVRIAPSLSPGIYAAPVQVERANGTIVAARTKTDSYPMTFTVASNETFYIKYTGASVSASFSLNLSLGSSGTVVAPPPASTPLAGDLNYLKKVTSVQYWFWRAAGTSAAPETGTGGYLNNDELTALRNLGVTALRVFVGPEYLLKPSTFPTTAAQRNARFKVIGSNNAELWFEYGPSVAGVSKIDPAKYNNLKAAIQNIINTGLGVELCMFDQDIAGAIEWGPDFPYNKTNKNTTLADRLNRVNLFAGYWNDLAGRLNADFSDRADRLFLETINEPEFNTRGANGDPNNAYNWRSYQRTIIAGIRSAAPTFTIIASPNSTSSASNSYFSDIDALAAFPLEAQDKQNIVWNFHLYEPGSISSQGTNFSRFVNTREGYLHDLPYPATQADTNAITGRLPGQPLEAFTGVFSNSFEPLTDTTSKQWAHAFQEQLRIEKSNPTLPLPYGQWEMAGAVNSYGYGYGSDIVVNGVKYYSAGSGWNASYFKARMRQVNAWASANGVRAFCGEFGASAAHAKYDGLSAWSDGTYGDGAVDASGNPNDPRARYLRDITKFLNDPLENGTTGAADNDRIFWGIWGLDDSLAMGLPRGHRTVMGGYDSFGQPRKFNGQYYIELQAQGKATSGRILTSIGNTIDRNRVDMDAVAALGFNTSAVSSSAAPIMPTNLSILGAPAAHNVRLNWSNNQSGTLSYQIRRRYSGETRWQTIGTISGTYIAGQSLTYTDTTLSGGGVKADYSVVALMGYNSIESMAIRVTIP